MNEGKHLRLCRAKGGGPQNPQAQITLPRWPSHQSTVKVQQCSGSSGECRRNYTWSLTLKNIQTRIWTGSLWKREVKSIWRDAQTHQLLGKVQIKILMRCDFIQIHWEKNVFNWMIILSVSLEVGYRVLYAWQVGMETSAAWLWVTGHFPVKLSMCVTYISLFWFWVCIYPKEILTQIHKGPWIKMLMAHYLGWWCEVGGNLGTRP